MKTIQNAAQTDLFWRVSRPASWFENVYWPESKVIFKHSCPVFSDSHCCAGKSKEARHAPAFKPDTHLNSDWLERSRLEKSKWGNKSDTLISFFSSLPSGEAHLLVTVTFLWNLLFAEAQLRANPGNKQLQLNTALFSFSLSKNCKLCTARGGT